MSARMPLNCAFALAALALLSSPCSWAAEISPRVEDRRLAVALSDIAFPETLARDLRSGLENRILIQVALLAASRTIARNGVTIAIKYDLWDEKFKLRTMGDGRIEELEFSDTALLIAYLAAPRLGTMFSLDALPDTENYQLRAEILINPIDREKMERLRQWVADNSAPGGAVRAGSGTTPLTPRPNDLFNKIFEQYIGGADLVAPWRITVTSKPFTLRDLHVAP